jgi:hypothetical protein
MLATLQPSPLNLWRDRLGGKRRSHHQPRPWGALGYLANGPVIEHLIEIEKLILVVLYDEPFGHGQQALRLAGYSGKLTSQGVQWGGPERCHFFKDLRLQPVRDGRGLRLDVASGDLIRLGLALDRTVECHARHRLAAQRPLRLPPLWAGFRPADAASVVGEGPECAAACEQLQISPAQLLNEYRREHFGLVLYPLVLVPQHSQQAVAVFADLDRYPLRHAFRLSRPSDELTGSHGPANFDLFNSRFRPRPPSPAKRQANRRAYAFAAR